MFQMVTTAIDQAFISEMQKEMKDLANGAAVTFEGIVRNHNEGKKVQQLEYQSYESMAIKVGGKIIEEAKELFEITGVFCVHRTGLLQIGETAVWVMATAHHRQAAFLACEYVINEVKTRVPIWKREFYANQLAEWVACHHCGNAKLEHHNHVTTHQHRI